jgi:hypothetical protein
MELNKITILLLLWGAVTAVWIVLIIYRGILGQREDDQIFLDPAEERMAQEQRELVARIERLGPPIWVLGIFSGVLLLAAAGAFLWPHLQTFF